MRALDNWIEYTVDGKPFFGRFTFYKLHTTEKVAITSESGVALSNPILSDAYGRTSSQVFLPDEDVTVVMEKYIGSGDMSEAPDTIEFWSEARTFDSLRNTTIIDIDGQGVVAGYAGTITELREMDITKVNYAMLAGYNVLGDMPPVFYKLEVNNISADDGGSVVRADTEHVWRLVTPQILDVRVFGVFPSDNYVDVAPQNSQLQAAFNYANSKGIALYMPSVYGSGGYYAFEGGAHNLTNTLYLDNGAHLCAKTGTTSTVVVDKIEGAAAGFLHYDGVYNAGKITLTVKSIRTSWLNNWLQGDYKLVATNEMIVDSPVELNAPQTFSNLTRVSIETPNWDPLAAVGFDDIQEFVSPGNLSMNCRFTFYNMTGITDRWWNLTEANHRIDPAKAVFMNCQYTLHDFSYVDNFVRLQYVNNDERTFNLEGRTYDASVTDVFNNTTWINGEISNLNLSGTVTLRNIKGSVYGSTAQTWTNVSIEDCYITGSLPYSITGDFYAKSSTFSSTADIGSSLPVFHGSSCVIRDCIFNGYSLQVPYNAVITGCTFDKNKLGAYSSISAYVSYPAGLLSITFSDNVLNGAKLNITTLSVLQNGFTVSGSVFVSNSVTDSRDGTNFIKWSGCVPAESGHSYSYRNNDGPDVLQQDSYTVVLQHVANWFNDGVSTPPATPYIEYTGPHEVFSVDIPDMIVGYSTIDLGAAGTISVPVYGKSEDVHTYAFKSRLVGLTVDYLNLFCFSYSDFANKRISISVQTSKKDGEDSNRYLGTGLGQNSIGIPANLSLPDFTVNAGAQSAADVPVPYAYQDLVLTTTLTDVRVIS